MRLPEANLIWSNILKLKHIFFIWLANHDKLLTKERLMRLHIPVADVTCSLCDRGRLKSQLHLFAECKRIEEVENDIYNWMEI